MVGMFEEVPDFTNFLCIFFPIFIFHINGIVVKYQIVIPNFADIIEMIMKYLQRSTCQSMNRYRVSLFEKKVNCL